MTGFKLDDGDEKDCDYSDGNDNDEANDDVGDTLLFCECLRRNILVSDCWSGFVVKLWLRSPPAEKLISIMFFLMGKKQPAKGVNHRQLQSFCDDSFVFIKINSLISIFENKSAECPHNHSLNS